MSERMIYDRKKMELMSIMLVADEHPEWPEEKKVAVGKIESNVQKVIFNRTIVDLRNKLFEEYGGIKTKEQCFEQAIWIMNNIPKKNDSKYK